MIILRNKLNSNTNEKTNSEKISPNSWSESLNGFGNNPFPSSKVDPGNEGNTTTPGLIQSARQTNRSANMFQKVMSDSPMGISYVRDGKKKKAKNKSHIAKLVRDNSNFTINKSNKVLKKLPVLSDESKLKAKRKLEAIKFYLDYGTNKLDEIAENFYSEKRMPVSSADMRKAETDGVVQRRPDGKWGIIAKKKRLWWSAGYDSRESAEAALRAYHAGRH